MSRTFLAVLQQADGRFTKQKVAGRDRTTVEESVASRHGRPPVQLIETDTEPSAEAKATIKIRWRLAFYRSLASFLRAGLTINNALTLSVRTAVDKKAKAVTAAIAKEVNRGKSVAATLARFPNMAPAVIVGMIAAGEFNGKTAEAIQQAFAITNGDYELNRAVKRALIYPGIVLVVAAIVVAILMWKAVPVLAEVFLEMGVQLPWLTRVLVDISNATIKFWPLFVGVAVTLFLFRRRLVSFIQSPVLIGGKPLIHKAILKLPQIGKLLLEVNEARLVQTLSMLLGAGQTFPEALRLCRAMSWLLPVSAAVTQIQSELSRGEHAHLAFAKHEDVFSPTLTAMLETGKEAGGQANALASYLPEAIANVDDRVNMLQQTLQPALIVGLAVVVGGIVAAIFLPIFQLPDVISK